MSQCQKVPYETKGEASSDAVAMHRGGRHFSRAAARARKGVNKLRPYECNRCGKWHLTSWNRARAKA